MEEEEVAMAPVTDEFLLLPQNGPFPWDDDDDSDVDLEEPSTGASSTTASMSASIVAPTSFYADISTYRQKPFPTTTAYEPAMALPGTHAHAQLLTHRQTRTHTPQEASGGGRVDMPGLGGVVDLFSPQDVEELERQRHQQQPQQQQQQQQQQHQQPHHHQQQQQQQQQHPPPPPQPPQQQHQPFPAPQDTTSSTDGGLYGSEGLMDPDATGSIDFSEFSIGGSGDDFLLGEDWAVPALGGRVDGQPIIQHYRRRHTGYNPLVRPSGRA